MDIVNLDILTIIVFSLVVVACGMSFSSSGKDMKSFFGGGGAVPWGISGLSLFMSFFSAGTFVVWGAIAYDYGMVAVAIQATMSIAGFIIGFVFAPRWQKTGVLTAAEFITQRFGYNTQKIYSYLFLLISIFTTGSFLYPVAKILEVYTGIPVYQTTIAIGLLILLYTAVGGLWAVIVTDVLQFVVLTTAVLILLPLAFERIGGVNSFIHKAPTEFFKFSNDEYSIGFLIAFGLYNLFFISGNWAYVQRYTAVNNPSSAKKVGWLFGALYAISALVWMLPPMIYHIINPDLTGSGSEGAYLLISEEVLPAGMMGLMLGAMVFATSSSVNTTLNISAGVFTNDLYNHFFPESSQEKLIKVARVTTVILGLITIGVALLVPFMGGIINVVLSVAALTGGALYLPPLWSLFSTKQSGQSILSVTVLSLFVNLFFKFLSPILLGFSLSRSMEMIIGVAVPIFLLLISEFLIKTEEGFSEDFQNYLKVGDKKAVEIPQNNSTSQENIKGKKVLSIGIMAIGSLMAGLGLYSYETSWLIFVAGVIIIMIALIIYPKKTFKLKIYNRK